jgi:hypothetical protein
MSVRTTRLTKTTHEGQATNEELAPRDGFEPPAKRLTVACSTAELPGNKLKTFLYITRSDMQACFVTNLFWLQGCLIRHCRCWLIFQ